MTDSILSNAGGGCIVSYTDLEFIRKCRTLFMWGQSHEGSVISCGT